MLVEPSFLRKHRLYRCRDKPTRICFGARGINVFNNAVCGRQQSRFVLPKRAKLFDQKLQRNALLRSASDFESFKCLIQNISMAVQPPFNFRQTELLGGARKFKIAEQGGVGNLAVRSVIDQV